MVMKLKRKLSASAESHYKIILLIMSITACSSQEGTVVFKNVGQVNSCFFWIDKGKAKEISIGELMPNESEEITLSSGFYELRATADLDGNISLSIVKIDIDTGSSYTFPVNPDK